MDVTMCGREKKKEKSDEKQLRTSAENLLSTMPDSYQENIEKTNLEVIHELRVHQVELEIQNEELKKAQLELELSRDRYRDLYDFAPVGYFTVTNTALIKEVNLSGAALLGVARGQLMNARFRGFVSPLEYDVWDRFFLALLEEDEKQTCMLSLDRSDGKRIDVRIQGVRVLTDAGVFQGRILVLDISGQKEADEKIRILAQIADEAPASITIHDFLGNILYANEETFRLHGYTREEFLVKNLHEIDFPESEPYIEERMQKIRDVGEAEFEVYHYRKDGSSFPLLVHAKMVTWAKKSVLLSIATDLTERKQAEKNRIESEERYRGLIREIPDYILVHRGGKILFENPAAAAALHYTLEEMVGTPLLSYVAPESHAVVTAAVQERIAGKEILLYEITVLTKEGMEHIAEVRGTRILYEGEAASLVVLNDITNRKKAENALQEALSKLHLLTSLTRHDIINQLTAIQLYHDMALETGDVAQVYDYISNAKEVCNKLEAIIGFTREYEEFGTISSGWQRIYQILDLVKREISLGKTTVINQIPEDLEVYSDPIIRKVFSTLMDNSIRHGGVLSTIRFSCHEEKGSMVIVFEDDGIGIPDQEKERIFQNGYGKNTGIGLFLAREILSITGLTIRESGVEGKGSRFEITVPVGKFRRTPG